MSQQSSASLELEIRRGPEPAAEQPQQTSRLGFAIPNPAIPFGLEMPDGRKHQFGQGAPRFFFRLKNKQGVRAVMSLDEGLIADAYLSGNIDFEGDPLGPFQLRGSLKDSHLFTALWRFVQPLVFGQVHTNRQAIISHYEMDPAFFLRFLDPNTPCYTQGVFQNDDEALDVATIRKFDYCYERLGLKAGDHILEIGPGWGAWFEYASKRGVKCTGISISQTSIEFLNGRARQLGYDWELIYADLLNYETTRKYDAIVIMGVIEHLPKYDQVLRKFVSLLKPGAKIFLDGSANTKKYRLCSFMVKHIYPGNHSFLVLHDFLAAVARTPLRVSEIISDRHSYYLTFRQWARNLDGNRELIVKQFGEFHYRRFRVYLWGATYQFWISGHDCYRMIIEYPTAAPAPS